MLHQGKQLFQLVRNSYSIVAVATLSVIQMSSVCLNFTVGPPLPPVITETSFESTSISISWQDDDTVDHYEIQYNFTVRECANDMDMQITSIGPQMIMANSYVLLNGTETRVEEDSNYSISLTAVNSIGKSQATIITNMTLEAGKVVHV